MEKRGTVFYRPELDTLRLLAFSLVFCHHSFVSALAGTYAGLPWQQRIAAAIALGGEFEIIFSFSVRT